jgi:hypothetical protein
MSSAPQRKRDERHQTVVGFYPANSASGFAAGVSNASGWISGTYHNVMPMGGGTTSLPYLSAGVYTSSTSQEGYEPELSEQILKLAKKPPVAVFDSPEEMMEWLDNASK